MPQKHKGEEKGKKQNSYLLVSKQIKWLQKILVPSSVICRENIVGTILSMLSTTPTSIFLPLRDADADADDLKHVFQTCISNTFQSVLRVPIWLAII